MCRYVLINGATNDPLYEHGNKYLNSTIRKRKLKDGSVYYDRESVVEKRGE